MFIKGGSSTIRTR
uniref:Uncharacterized protein n=1 Tax=Arundo donax TaxID=35708 RepID=A0A0A9AL08_ARUDO